VSICHSKNILKISTGVSHKKTKYNYKNELQRRFTKNFLYIKYSEKFYRFKAPFLCFEVQVVFIWSTEPNAAGALDQAHIISPFKGHELNKINETPWSNNNDP